MPNQGSITLRVNLPTQPANGQTCPDPGTTYAAGLPAPSTTSPGGSLVDGEHGTQVSCAVRGTGPFTFSGSLKATATTGEPFPIQVVFTDGSVGADFTGTSNISIYSPKLAGNFSGTSCVVQVIGQQIKGGAIWASFSCPSVFEPPAQQCTASGIFVFENCLGS